MLLDICDIPALKREGKTNLSYQGAYIYICFFYIYIYMKYQNYNQTINIQQNKIIN